MSNLAWYSLQIVVALVVFVAIGETVGVADRGLAPAFVSLAVAFGVTVSVSNFMDWRRRRANKPPPLPSTAGSAVSDELDGHAGSGGRSLGHPSDSPELIGRRGIGQNPRKLI